MERLRAPRLVDDFFVTRPLQETALGLLTSPTGERHIRSLATSLRERCGTLAAAVTKELPHWSPARIPTGGLHLWVGLPYGTDDAVTADTARRHGVAVSAGNRYVATDLPAAYLRALRREPVPV